MKLPNGLLLQTTFGESEWVFEGVVPWSRTAPLRVHNLVPRGFDSYARVLHSIEDTGARRTLSWAEVAREHGTELEPGSTFREVTNVASGESLNLQRTPRDGCLPREQLDRLAAALERHTSSESVGYCYWDGYGFLWPSIGHDLSPAASEAQRSERAWREAQHNAESAMFRVMMEAIPRIYFGDRDYYFFKGPRPSSLSFDFAGPYQSPTILWPDDRAWCVATEIDSYSTYVGGTLECATEVATVVEALQVDEETRADPGPFP